MEVVSFKLCTNSKDSESDELSGYLFDPVALHSVLRDIIPRDHAGDFMIRIHYN